MVTPCSLAPKQVLHGTHSEGGWSGEGKALTVQWLRHPPTCPVLYTPWVATSFFTDNFSGSLSLVTFHSLHFQAPFPLHYKKILVNLCKDFIIHWVLKLKGLSLHVIKSRLLSGLVCCTLPSRTAHSPHCCWGVLLFPWFLSQAFPRDLPIAYISLVPAYWCADLHKWLPFNFLADTVGGRHWEVFMELELYVLRWSGSSVPVSNSRSFQHFSRDGFRGYKWISGRARNHSTQLYLSIKGLQNKTQSWPLGTSK